MKRLHLTVATVITYVFTVSALELVEPEDLMLFDTRQLGVFHYSIPCYLSSLKEESKAFSGTMHFFLRGVSIAQGTEVSGFAVFIDSNKPLLAGGVKHENPNVLAHWSPRVFFRDAARKEYELTVFGHVETKRPLHLLIVLPKNVVEGTLHVAHFNRYFSINNLLQVALRSSPRAGPLEVYTAIGQFHSLSKALALRFLKLHMDWHERLGFRGTLLYVTTEYIKYFASYDMDPYIQKHRLLPILWDMFPRIDGVVHYDQSIIYQHALLSLWQRNAYVFLTDLDELFATPAPANVVHLLQQGCLRETEQILIDSYGVYCVSCMEDANERDNWIADDTLLPAHKYTLRSTRFMGLPKVLAHADFVTHMFVHSGQIRPGLEGRTDRLGSLDCAWIAHLRNLFGARDSDPDTMVNDASWLWPLNNTT